MWHYDQATFPPAPKMDVQIFKAGISTRSVNLHAKLDTGASITVIPEQFVAWLDLPSHENTRARGFDGKYQSYPLYLIDLRLNGIYVDWIDCIATKREDVLLGRNVLNLFFIPLDGPNLTFDIK
jgi:predicted aspartyl protease